MRVEDIRAWTISLVQQIWKRHSGERTRNVDGQHGDEKPVEQGVHSRRGHQSLEHQSAFTANPERVEDIKRVVPESSAPVYCTHVLHQQRKRGGEGGRIPQPTPPRRHPKPRNLQRKEPIANTLGHAPSAQAPEKRIITQLRLPPTTTTTTTNNNLPTQPQHPKRIHHPPNQQQPTRNLHKRRDDGRAHNTQQRVQDLQPRERLRGRQQRVVDFVKDNRERRILDRDEVHRVQRAGRPQREREKVVAEEVEASYKSHFGGGRGVSFPAVSFGGGGKVVLSWSTQAQ